MMMIELPIVQREKKMTYIRKEIISNTKSESLREKH
jgi:hypothetical protein